MRAKNRCLCCFLLAYFYFVTWVLLVHVFVRLKFVCKKKINRFKIVSIASVTYTTNVYPLNPPIEAFIYTHLFLFVVICVDLFFYEIFFVCENISFHENSFESFLSVRISFFLWKLFEFLLSVRISFLWELFLNLFSLWKSFALFFICEKSFLNLYENKPAYECHHLKHIFYHWKQINTLS